VAAAEPLHSPAHAAGLFSVLSPVSPAALPRWFAVGSPVRCGFSRTNTTNGLTFTSRPASL